MFSNLSRPLKFLVFFCFLLVLFIIGGAGYYFYLGRKVPTGEISETVTDREFDLALSLAPRPEGAPNLDPLTNTIDDSKSELSLSLLKNNKVGFISSSYITNIYTAEFVEITENEQVEVEGITLPFALRIKNANGNELTLNFSETEISKMRVFLTTKPTPDTEEVKPISYKELLPGDDLIVTISINLLDARKHIDDVGILATRN